MRILGRRAVPREMLGTGRDAVLLQARHVGRDVRRGAHRVRAERADTDDRVLRRERQVGARRQVDRDPAGRQPFPEGGGDRRGQLRIARRAERQRPRHERPGRDVETRDVAALLIDADDDVRPRRPQLGGQLRDLGVVDDVTAEEDHPTETLFDAAPQPVRRRRPGETGQQNGFRELLR